MRMNNTVFLFPAFILKYKGNEIFLIEKHAIDFKERLKNLTEITGVDLTDYDLKHNNFLDDELKNQLITYLISCLYNDILISKKQYPSYLCGLSMGLYAALYAAGSITFEEGATLIKRVFEVLLAIVKNKSYKMLAVIGLTSDDIFQIIKKENLNCELVIKNADHSFILSGETPSIVCFIEKAKAEGALHLTTMPVNIPYHSSYIKLLAAYHEEIIKNINVEKSRYRILSAIDNTVLTTEKKIQSEIINNIMQAVDWQKNMLFFLSKGENVFLECGPGDSLKRISKFIDGEFSVKGLQDIEK